MIPAFDIKFLPSDLKTTLNRVETQLLFVLIPLWNERLAITPTTWPVVRPGNDHFKEKTGYSRTQLWRGRQLLVYKELLIVWQFLHQDGHPSTNHYKPGPRWSARWKRKEKKELAKTRANPLPKHAPDPCIEDPEMQKKGEAFLKRLGIKTPDLS